MIKKLFTFQGRTKIMVQNIIVSVGLKGFSILASFLLVTLYLNSVNQRLYGIILTITSIANFISFFDVGIGNGLRNKLGKAIAEDDKLLGRKYVSTAYLYICIMFASFFVVYLMASPFIDWSEILNIKKSEIPNLNSCFIFIVLTFALRFIFQPIGVILLADQKSSINDSILAATNVLTVAFFYILKATHQLNFFSIITSFSVAPIIILLSYTFILFSKKYAWLRPSFKFVDHKLRKDLLGLGIQFFLIQIVSIVIFSTTNILIAQLFKIDYVAQYNIAYKYYNVSSMVFTILLTPVWGAFTNAWFQKEYTWIYQNIKKYLLINLGLTVIGIAQYFLYPYVSLIWLKKDFPIQTLLSVSLILYNFIFCFNNIFAFFLNGIGQIKTQVYCAVIGGIINIPLTIWLGKHTSLMLSSIVFANIICLLPSTIFTSIETFKLLKNASNSHQSAV